MGGGGGIEWDPVKDLANLANDPVGTIASAIVNIGTGGILGMKDGKLTTGVNLNAANEALGSVTGANAARKAAFQAKDAADDAITREENERKRQIQLQEASERQASLKGASKRGNLSNTSSVGTGGSNIEQQAALDLLGL